MDLESKVEKTLREQVKKLGGVCYKFVSPGNVGVPDRIILLGGEAVFVELKADDGELSAAQKVQFTRIGKAFGPVNVVYGMAGLQMFLRSLKAGTLPGPAQCLWCGWKGKKQ